MILVNFVRVELSNLFLIFVNETLLHYSNEVLDVRRNAILKNELTYRTFLYKDMFRLCVCLNI